MNDSGRTADVIRAERYIADIPMWTKKKNSLEDIRKFLTALHISEKNIIHVAGTNGKGSVCAYLTSILRASHYTVGTFVSPHLTDIKERFLIDGNTVDDDDFSAAFAKVLSVTEEKCAEGFAHPSYFEFCFLMAMTIFTEKDVDFRVLETGMGGRLDATNSVKDALACVITSISLDHTRYLGNTIEEIAAEKAGIIKTGVPVIYDASDAAAAHVIAQTAKEKGAAAFPVCARDISSGDISACGKSVIFPQGISFSAPYQKVNAALALQTLDVLEIPGVTRDTVYEGLSSFEWQGRMEEIRPGIWLDGAHNPGGISAFIDAVKDQQNESGPFGVHLIFASADDKDYAAMIHILSKGLHPAHVTVTAFEGERAADPDELGRLFVNEGTADVKVIKKPEAALASALSEPELSFMDGGARLYIVGSLYLAGEIRKCFMNNARYCL